MKLSQHNKLLRTATLKTVAAFLNSYFGGTLVIGVADNRLIVGLDYDYSVIHREGRDDPDRFQEHLMHLLADSMGIAAATCVTTDIHHVEGHDVCRVHVESSPYPVKAKIAEVDGKGQVSRAESFYVRLNTGTGPIIDQTELDKYMARRWGRAGADQTRDQIQSS